MDLAELVAQLEGKRGGASQSTAQSHVASCAHCQSELALLHSFEESPVRAEEREDVDAITERLSRNPVLTEPDPWWKRIWKVPFLVPSLAAVAAAMLAVMILNPTRQTSNQPFTPGNDVMRSATVEAIAPIGDVSQLPQELQWRPFSGAAKYNVRLTEVDRTELFTTSTLATTLTLPSSIRLKIQPLKTLTWDVEAIDAAGRTIGDSGLQRFRFVNSKPQ
jgi:hypothetical protein